MFITHVSTSTSLVVITNVLSIPIDRIHYLLILIDLQAVLDSLRVAFPADDENTKYVH